MKSYNSLMIVCLLCLSILSEARPQIKYAEGDDCSGRYQGRTLYSFNLTQGGEYTIIHGNEVQDGGDSEVVFSSKMDCSNHMLMDKEIESITITGISYQGYAANLHSTPASLCVKSQCTTEQEFAASPLFYSWLLPRWFTKTVRTFNMSDLGLGPVTGNFLKLNSGLRVTPKGLMVVSYIDVNFKPEN